MDLEFVKGLIEAVDGSGIDSLEITRAGTRVKISKTPPAAVPAPSYVPPPAHAPAPQPGSPAGAAPPAGAGSETAPAPGADTAAGEPSGLTEVTSPMVGTFYRAPAPDAPPYVEVGTRVTKGQTLCILEAMKLMNELESEVEGVIREILVENAEPVEYGQVLFRIDPNG
ncbi:MAG: acetyl-CoA carboxylase biotin carboxyl carrier protein [Gemmatimonadetes bacterium]|nr:acetyl-CoA carboxylase biotin carboxyl carrier protein [Gemmatimonadota bacterium]NIQ54826.1 acetyl-CoA carboxylase biotin carboxyl carrier protein [Gemmatimonadota bacterium]NIU75023.1 acetyl-CoA carboxylase biotin carboxyl carrier protein [Gammaproteobacteria bacterium]NIX44887.1 acetyl-CoA carboxylase biotin carboxyl carrier protein [Gemmatimonadota bacterium]NIY09124.1 acetyl-CoA carboxylase biotin carboxyl carrier protein [Gemmatimonadota bacterium]